MASFSSAFASARKAGKSEFTWNGKRYNTKLKSDTKSVPKPSSGDSARANKRVAEAHGSTKKSSRAKVPKPTSAKAARGDRAASKAMNTRYPSKTTAKSDRVGATSRNLNTSKSKNIQTSRSGNLVRKRKG